MPSLSPFALNDSGQTTQLFDYSKFPGGGKNASKVYHGVSIVADDQIIGRISSYQDASKTRAAVHKWELSHQTFGRPVDLIPGKADGYTITITRSEVWDQEIEIALGYVTDKPFSDLMDMRFPIELHEYLYRGQVGNTPPTTPNKHWVYPMCWITSIGDEAYTTDGEGAIISTVEMMHLPRNLIR